MLDLNFEESIKQKGYKYIGGIDEAGRGPLAGPVVSACVIIDEGFCPLDNGLSEVADSKKLTEKKREYLYQIIMDLLPNVGVGICDHHTIDRINILQATFLAMKKAIGDMKQKPDYLLIDGKFPIPNLSIHQAPVVKGDSKVFSIAAASIVAKVTRDRIMREMDEKYPEYSFLKHKGYGTKVHLESLEKHGPCEIHRQSFAPVKRFKN